MTGVLIGRAAELERISALEASEPTAAVMVVGEPGSGKSRLLAEAAKRSSRRVVRVVGYEPERLVPFAAASELLRAVAADTAFEAAAEPIRVFEATYRGLHDAGRVLLVVDDVQWVDELSLALLHYVVRAAGSGVAVLAAGRAVAQTYAFGEDLARLLPERQAPILELAPLGRDDALALAHALEPRLTDEAAEAVWERSGGLPFWIDALARAGGAPVEAARLLTGRLRDAGRDAAALLGPLAVVARPITPDELAALLEWPVARIEAAADDLAARGVAARVRGQLRPAHDLLREAAYAELPERPRRDLHRRVSEWLEANAGDDVSLLREALEHRVAAADPAAELAVRLVSAPQRRRLGAAGLQMLAEIADEVDPATPQGQTLRAQVPELAFELGEHQIALDRWRTFAPLASDETDRFRAYLGASKAALALGVDHAELAHELLRRAADAAQDEADAVAARIHEARLVLWLDNDTAAGAAIAAEAVMRSEALGTSPAARRVRLTALHAAREAAMQQADGHEMLRLAEAMLALTRDDDDHGYAEALLSRAAGEHRTLPLSHAERTVREALEFSTRRMLPAEAAESGAFLGTLLLDRGRLDEADRVLVEANEIAARIYSMQPARLVEHELRLIRGDLDGGIPAFRAAAAARPDPHKRIIPAQWLAQFLSRVHGEAAADQVLSILDDAHRDAEHAACPRCSSELQRFAAAALARIGRVQEATAEIESAERIAPLDHVGRYWLEYARALVTAADDAPRGAALLEEVAADAERTDRRVERLWIRLELARTVRRDRTRAVELLRSVGAEADAMGAGAIAQVAERELRRLGVRTWRRSRRMAQGTLSEREREIAQLVRTGASNPEIAQALFLSRKTVERHVSNVLAKLGARNRAELAALLAREGEGAPR